MSEPSENVTLSLTKEVLERVSPEELPLANHFDPKQPSRGVSGKGALGFGVEAAIPMLLPIVYLFFDGVLEEIKEDIKGVGKHAADAVFARVAALFQRRGSLTDKERLEATDAVLKYLTDEGIEKSRATEVAHTMIDVVSENRSKIIP